MKFKKERRDDCAICGSYLDDLGFCPECTIEDFMGSVSKKDMVSSPEHYNKAGGLECIDAMEAMVSEAKNISPHAFYCWQAAFKYIWRWHYKGGEQDLDKAIWYLERMKEKVYGNKK